MVSRRFKNKTRAEAYLGGGNGPDLEVIGSHKEVSQTNTHLAQNPLVKGLGLDVGDARLESGIDHALDAAHLLLLGKHGNVVLEGVGNPLALAADVGNPLVGVPVVRLG